MKPRQAMIRPSALELLPFKPSMPACLCARLALNPVTATSHLCVCVILRLEARYCLELSNSFFRHDIVCGFGFALANLESGAAAIVQVPSALSWYL